MALNDSLVPVLGLEPKSNSKLESVLINTAIAPMFTTVMSVYSMYCTVILVFFFFFFNIIVSFPGKNISNTLTALKWKGFWTSYQPLHGGPREFENEQ